MKEKHISLSIKEILEGFKSADIKGIALLLDPNKEGVHFMLNGNVYLIGNLLSNAFDNNSDFLITVMATIAEKATHDKKTREAIKDLVGKIEEIAEE